jgi:hypothetical protein
LSPHSGPVKSVVKDIERHYAIALHECQGMVGADSAWRTRPGSTRASLGRLTGYTAMVSKERLVMTFFNKSTINNDVHLRGPRGLKPPLYAELFYFVELFWEDEPAKSR